MPNSLLVQLQTVAENNQDSLSYTAMKMIEIGLLVSQNSDKKTTQVSTDPVQQHCQKLIMQMNELIKSMARNKAILDYEPKDFEELKEKVLIRFDELTGVKKELL